MQTKHEITSGNIAPILFKMALGMLIGHIALTAFNLTDTYFVSKLGTLELAAMSYTFPVVLMVNHFLFGLGLGTSATIAKAIGQKDFHEARRLSTDSLFLIIATGTLFGAVGLFTIRPIFYALGARGETLELVIKYMRICCYGMPISAIAMVIDNAIRATGDTKTPGLIIAFNVSLNAVLDPVFIFGFAGIPAMGIEGAAIATMIARIIGSACTVSFIHFKMRMFDFNGTRPGVTLQSWKKILRLGVPVSLALMLMPISQAIVTRITAFYGDPAVAALGAGGKIDSLALMGIFSLSSVIIPFTGQNLGAGRTDRVRDALRLCEKFSLYWGLFIFTVFLIFRVPIAGVFTEDPIVLKYISAYMVINSIAFPAVGSCVMCSNVINGLQKPLRTTMLHFMRTIVFLVPAVWFCGKMWQAEGIFIGISSVNILAFFAYHAAAKRTIEESRQISKEVQ